MSLKEVLHFRLEVIFNLNYIQVKEHLELFATMKGVEDTDMERAVHDMVDEVRFRYLISCSAACIYSIASIYCIYIFFF